MVPVEHGIVLAELPWGKRIEHTARLVECAQRAKVLATFREGLFVTVARTVTLLRKKVN